MSSWYRPFHFEAFELLRLLLAQESSSQVLGSSRERCVNQTKFAPRELPEIIIFRILDYFCPLTVGTEGTLVWLT